MAAKQRYRVSEKVDAGGMAEIFRGQAVSLDGIEKEVAIKRIRPHLATNKKFITMFIDEARLSMRLNHANITSVFDVGRAQGTYFLVMEYVNGANLRRITQVADERGYKIPVAITVYLGIEVCKALHHAHSATGSDGKTLNIVHRDVSPPNILVSRQGEVKITDFGLAKAVSHLEITDPGVVKGKFSYLSPEACEGQELDPRADIFSLGIILHEMLTGRRLFMGKNDIETVELVRKCDVPRPSTFNPEVAPELDEVILKALAKDRKRRFQSASDLGDSLAEYLFEKNLKVTNFDVLRMMRFLFEEEDQSGAYPKRVMEIIREEIINLSSMGKLPGLNPTDGGKPLDMGEFQKRHTPFEDVWKEFEQLPEGEELVDTVGAGAAAKPLTRAEKKEKERKERERQRQEARRLKEESREKEAAAKHRPVAANSGKKTRWWLVILVIVLGAAAGAAGLLLLSQSGYIPEFF